METENKNNWVTYTIVDSVWEIEIVPAHSPDLFVNGSECNGTAWFTPQRICLSAEIPKRSVKRVIIHELVHAYLYATQMAIPEKMGEEEVCDFFGCWGSEIMKAADWIFDQLYVYPKSE